MPLKLYNSLTKRLETFTSLKDKEVSMYTCGPTVYNYAHLGNLRSYIFADILKRTLVYNGFKVKQVMNITDVGHLAGDADDGEDKMELAVLREKKTVWQIAKFYTDAFRRDLKKLNISEPKIWCKATDHINEQIELIKTLEAKGFTYHTSDGIYFDTSLVKDYGKLAQLDLEGLKEGARVKKHLEKKNPTDFALWKFSPTDKKRAMEWPSPWGVGFPGWHIECSAMSMKYLGETFDIHTGGIDHKPVHHTNEIAQSESATGKPLAKFWLHGEFVVLDKGLKMAKSKENFLTLSVLKDKGFNPLAYRYFTFGTHYRHQLTFSWQALEAAAKALSNLTVAVAEYDKPAIGCAEFEEKFLQAINDDLNMPRALAVVWELVKSGYPSAAKKKSLLKFDQILGLGLDKAKKHKVTAPADVKELVTAREKARQSEDWATADRLRQEIRAAGFEIEDAAKGPVLRKR